MAKIYLIDDHVLVREGMAAVLTSAGHWVVGGDSGQVDCLDRVIESQAEVLLLDLNLQNQSGQVILSAIQRRAPGVAVVILTMSASKRDLVDALKAGAKGYVLKGAPMADLLQAVQAAASGQQYLCSQSASLAAASLAECSEQELVATLSQRERQVIVMVTAGCSSVEIAKSLFLSPKTVESYRSRIMCKLNVGSLAGLIRFAIRNGLSSGQD